MKKTRVWKYNCDYCGKRSLSAGHMSRHEKYCTANPNRECRMCEIAGSGAAVPPADLALSLNRESEDNGIAELKGKVASCPACMLAAIRASGLAKYDGDTNPNPVWFKFDYKAECKSFWEVNNERAEREWYY